MNSNAGSTDRARETAQAGSAQDQVAVHEHHVAAAAAELIAAIRDPASDGAEVLARVLATVAANLGAMTAVTASRPGSWEAGHVDGLLAGVVGQDGEYLLAYRTAPIDVVECVEDSMDQLGVGFVYDRSYDLIQRVEMARLTDLAEAASDEEREQVYERVERAEQLIEDLRASDYQAYQARFAEQVRAAAQRLVDTEHLPDTIPVIVRFVASEHRDQMTLRPEAYETVESRLWEIARDQTPLPGLDLPPAEVPIRELERALREPGRMPHQRIPELAHYRDDRHSNTGGSLPA